MKDKGKKKENFKNSKFYLTKSIQDHSKESSRDYFIFYKTWTFYISYIQDLVHILI